MKLQESNRTDQKQQESLKGFVSINDLREKYFEEDELTTNERLALKNFDRYRITILTQTSDDTVFHQNYTKIQVKANLSPYTEFLKEEYYT